MRTIRATMEYDGANFAGSQTQPNARTVQAEIERAVAAVIGSHVPIVAAGRTDAGVHASGQVISFRIDTALDDRTLMRAVNAHLAPDVAVRELNTVFDDFHARRSAVTRTYQYRIIQRPGRPVLDRERGWFVAGSLDVAAMQAAADEFVGSHDFLAFTIRAVLGTVREIMNVAVWREGDSVFVRVEGNAFLHRMVRRMVGTLVRVGKGELTASDVRALLRGGARSQAGPAAPAHGLTLINVTYEGAHAVRGSSHPVEASAS